MTEAKGEREPHWLREQRRDLPDGWRLEVTKFTPRRFGAYVRISAPGGMPPMGPLLIGSWNVSRHVRYIAKKRGLPDPYEQSPHACRECGTALEKAEHTLCGECCDCNSSHPSPCPKCGAMDEDEHGPVEHNGQPDHGGNELGLPRMPEPAAAREPNNLAPTTYVPRVGDLVEVKFRGYAGWSRGLLRDEGGGRLSLWRAGCRLAIFAGSKLDPDDDTRLVRLITPREEL